MMDSYRDRVKQEIHACLDELAKTGTKWAPSWIANKICRGHYESVEETDDTEFLLWTSYQYVRDFVRKEINALSNGEVRLPDPAQLDLIGFERVNLQSYYLVPRGDEPVAIYVMNLTDTEIDEKVIEYRKMGGSLYAHADELLRFKEWRRGRKTG